MADDQRRHQRLPVDSRVFIELVAPGLGSPQSGQVATCRTLDVSKGGLRVSLDRELPEGAILQIGVELPQSSETLYLAGEVRWCHRDQESERHWTAGFALLNADQSDIDRWVALLAAMEPGPQDRG
jgi:hypothetical protein